MHIDRNLKKTPLASHQGVMEEFAFGGCTRNMGVVYINFIPFVAMVTWREALLHGIRGRQPPDAGDIWRFSKKIKYSFSRQIIMNEKLWKIIQYFTFFKETVQILSKSKRNLKIKQKLRGLEQSHQNLSKILKNQRQPF